jgi:plasmid stabilization system protein ParE
MKIIWTELAIEKLEEYADYIALDKPLEAFKWEESMNNSVNKLIKFHN